MIAVILLLFAIKEPIFYALLVIYLIFLGKKTSYLPLALVFVCLVLFSYSIRRHYLKPLPSQTQEGYYEIVEVSSSTIILKNKVKIVVYNDSYDVKVGDVIFGKVHIKQLSTPSYTSDFDETTYYARKGVVNKGNLVSFEVVDHHFKIGYLKQLILSFYQEKLGPKSFAYLQAILFGEVALEKDVKTSYTSLYSSHILAISGLHIVFISLFLKIIWHKLFHIDGDILSLVILFFYLLLIGFPASALRAYLFLLIGKWNQRGSISYTQLDILSISFIGMVLCNPFFAYQQGFILSYLVSFCLIFMKEFHDLSRFKGKLITSLICIFLTLPFSINQSHEISLTGLALAFLIGFILSSILLPLLFFLLFVPVSFLEPIFVGLDESLLFLDGICIKLPYPAFSSGMMLIYYVLFMAVLWALASKRKRGMACSFLGMFLILMETISYGCPLYQITFIDVGQGDSTLLVGPHQEEVVLIDSYHNLDYLHSTGLSKIDVLFLTHFDKDHCETAQEVVEEFQVQMVYYPLYEDAAKIKNIFCEKRGIGGNQVIQTKQFSFEVLGPIVAHDTGNSNSLVLKSRIRETTFLFTGDMTIAEEEDLLNANCDLKATILKVAHHGSDSSSSLAFLKRVNPEVAVISVGEDNSYGLPSEAVVARFKNTRLYQTKEVGNIVVWVGNQYWVCPYREKKSPFYHFLIP